MTEPAIRHIWFPSRKRCQHTSAAPSGLLFSDISELDDQLVLSLLNRGIREQTPIQIKTWNAALSGRDVLGRSGTGTGKTLAFLLPALQQLFSKKDTNGQPKGTRILVLSPTRELALQINKETTLLLKNTTVTNFVSNQTVVGGVPKFNDIQILENQIPSILVATPGRLVDHLGETVTEDGCNNSVNEGTLSSNAPFAEYLRAVNILILDEVDRLMDTSFRGAVQRIVSELQVDRQTMAFSATIPSSVRRLLLDEGVIRSDHTFVDCVADGRVSVPDKDVEDSPWETLPREETAEIGPSEVEQSYVQATPGCAISNVVQTILYLMDQNPHHKILVFFPTTSLVNYFTNLFQLVLGRQVLSVHSKKDQNVRSITSDLFRHSRQAVLFTSDVSARGVDYPNVTHVVQVGVAPDRATYIHRLGRTGRAGKPGLGILLLLLKEEHHFLDKELSDLDIPLNQDLSEVLAEAMDRELDLELTRVAAEMRSGKQPLLRKAATDVYRASLSFYASRMRGLMGQFEWSISQRSIIEAINVMAAESGLIELPTVSEKLAKHVGPDRSGGLPLLRVQAPWQPGKGFDVGSSRQDQPARVERRQQDNKGHKNSKPTIH